MAFFCQSQYYVTVREYLITCAFEEGKNIPAREQNMFPQQLKKLEVLNYPVGTTRLFSWSMRMC